MPLVIVCAFMGMVFIFSVGLILMEVGEGQ